MEAAYPRRGGGGQGRLGAVHGAEQIDLDGAPHLLDRRPFQGAIDSNADVVDPGVDAPNVSRRLVRQPLHLHRLVPRREHDGGTLLSDETGGLAPDPGRCARDDDDLFRQGPGQAWTPASDRAQRPASAAGSSRPTGCSPLILARRSGGIVRAG